MEILHIPVCLWFLGGVDASCLRVGLDLGEGVGAADTAGLPKQYRPNAQLGRGAMAHRTMQPRTSHLQVPLRKFSLVPQSAALKGITTSRQNC